MKALFDNTEKYAMNIGVEALSKNLYESHSKSDCDCESDSDALPIYNNYGICSTIDPKESINSPTADQLSRFLSCLKNCHPFVNNLLLVQDHKC